MSRVLCGSGCGIVLMSDRRVYVPFLFVFLFFCSVSLAAAESLKEALSSAYQGNPALNAQRAAVRAIDEEVPRAKSGYRPTIIGTADTGLQKTQTNPRLTGDGDTDPKGYNITLSQPIFQGFRTLNAVREADANVRAAREDLRSTEQSILLGAATAYADVVRDQAVVGLRHNNVRVLSEQLRATSDRFGVGEVTRTDIAQAEARYSGAISFLNVAQANLKTSRANYRRIIGHAPGNLHPPTPSEKILPQSIDEALAIGTSESPEIIAALYREQASRHVVEKIRGELLPEVGLEASYQERFELSNSLNRREMTSVIGRVTVPLYQAGEVSARVRQAKQINYQRRDELNQSRDQVQSDVIAAWSNLASTRARLISDRAQIKANKTALDGVREEEMVGQRAILDILDAEQEYLNSQVTEVRTERDIIVSAFTLLAAIGRLTAADLGLNVKFYDVESYYHRAQGQWIGIGLQKK